MGSTTAMLLCTLGLYSSFCLASDDMKGYFKPTDCVKKKGEAVQFECSSPAGYTSLNYPSIAFIIERNGVQILERGGPDSQRGNFTSIEFNIKDVTKQDAGNYTCHIIATGSGRNVTLSTQVFVVEAEQKTTFVRKEKRFKLDCLNAKDHGFVPVVDWFVDKNRVSEVQESGMYKSDSSLWVSSAEIDQADRDIRCKVTSKSAHDSYGSFEAALGNGSGTEFQKSLSVVDVSMCKKEPCQLEARVYGGTPVDISWKLDGSLINSYTVVNDSVSISTTDVLNSTTSIELIITGGQIMWSQNISLDSSEHADEVNTDTEGLAVWAIVLIILAGVVVAVLIGVVCWKRKTCTNKEKKSEDQEMNETANNLL